MLVGKWCCRCFQMGETVLRAFLFYFSVFSFFFVWGRCGFQAKEVAPPKKGNKALLGGYARWATRDGGLHHARGGNTTQLNHK
jgi:hypothetical protein